jgi:ankyrin repeat protein
MPSDCRRTPLLWAARKRHEAVVKLLLAKDGVDPDSKDSNYGLLLLLFFFFNKCM